MVSHTHSSVSAGYLMPRYVAYKTPLLTLEIILPWSYLAYFELLRLKQKTASDGRENAVFDRKEGNGYEPGKVRLLCL